MNKLEVGMYVRTKHDGICKLYREFHEDSVDVGIGVFPEIEGFFIDEEEINYIEKIDILRVSNNIIQLIEVGDYVNGERVIALKNDISERNIHMNSKGNSIFVDYDLANDWYYGIDDEDIKSIVTKEQFSSMEYRLEGDKND